MLSVLSHCHATTGHVDFNVRADEYSIFRTQDFSWEDQGFSILSRYYPDIAEFFDCGMPTTPYVVTCGGCLPPVDTRYNNDHNFFACVLLESLQFPISCKTHVRNEFHSNSIETMGLQNWSTLSLVYTRGSQHFGRVQMQSRITTSLIPYLWWGVVMWDGVEL